MLSSILRHLRSLLKKILMTPLQYLLFSSNVALQSNLYKNTQLVHCNRIKQIATGQQIRLLVSKTGFQDTYIERISRAEDSRRTLFSHKSVPNVLSVS